MPDQSALDRRYFIDDKVYNCPFCNRRNVVYEITWRHSFDWSQSTKTHVYFVRCGSCGKESMHLSRKNLQHPKYQQSGYGHFRDDLDLDDEMFYSVPSSFHVIDGRIPKVMRELIAEAQGSLKSNFLTGASACARKVVYELAVQEKAEGQNYEDRIKSLKAKLPHIDPSYFDTLLTIQEVTSEKVHEESYDGWQGKHLRLILAALVEILNELYVIPKVREERRKAILGLKQEVLGQAGSGTAPRQISPGGEPEQVGMLEDPSGAVTMNEPEVGTPGVVPAAGDNHG